MAYYIITPIDYDPAKIRLVSTPYGWDGDTWYLDEFGDLEELGEYLGTHSDEQKAQMSKLFKQFNDLLDEQNHNKEKAKDLSTQEEIAQLEARLAELKGLNELRKTRNPLQ